MKKYDYLVVGAGLFGAIVARELTDAGKSCLVIDKRDHIAGNCHTEIQENIIVHKYGAHIFRTNSDVVWNYLNRFTKFNDYRHQVIADYKGEIYNLPFNMHTFYQIWGTKTPHEAKERLKLEQTLHNIDDPKNLEEQAISSVGVDIYEKLIKGYTEKQWGKSATELPAEIIKRIPVRFEYNNDYYFGEKYQGIPENGYTPMIENMLNDIDYMTNTDYFDIIKIKSFEFKNIIFTGPIDRFFEYEFGKLEYRSLRFEDEILDVESYQGTSVVNYTERDIPYTRIIEHKHFDSNRKSPITIITKEYPMSTGDEYYPINDEKNNALYNLYRDKADKLDNVYFGGRLGEYKYYDMNSTILSALDFAKKLIE